MTDVKINADDLLYLSENDDAITISKMSNDVNTNISAMINERGKIDYPLLEPDEPYKLCYGYDNIIYCSRKFY